MDTINAADLRQRLSETLDTVIAGASYTVTRSGRPIGVLVPMAVWEERTAVAVQLLADRHQVEPEDILLLSRSVPGTKTVHTTGPTPGSTLLYADAAAYVERMLARNREYPAMPA